MLLNPQRVDLCLDVRPMGNSGLSDCVHHCTDRRYTWQAVFPVAYRRLMIELRHCTDRRFESSDRPSNRIWPAAD
ncbi:hypothetical protein BHQ19_15285 [Mycolicibacterium porcinum]|nr:hypothetical protein BHQ19_15285 [Mycolicibacterium porcinum]